MTKHCGRTAFCFLLPAVFIENSLLVLHKWRAVAQFTPRLWAAVTIHMDVDSDPPKLEVQSKIAAAFLGRSGTSAAETFHGPRSTLEAYTQLAEPSEDRDDWVPDGSPCPFLKISSLREVSFTARKHIQQLPMIWKNLIRLTLAHELP
ncbi:hypothetical protein C8R44DRAFT_742267 [Mycena epipterygia]|nr:hypothetical protein C8R44DRAFT_742267 [Mycena epipterygia]